MRVIDKRAGALCTCVSMSVLAVLNIDKSASAQTAAQNQTLPPVTVEAPINKQRSIQKLQPAQAAPRAARRQAPAARPVVSRGPATNAAARTQEPAVDALAGVSVVGQEQINRTVPSRVSDIFNGMPSVWFADRPDTPGSSINVRGLQDFGRVEVLVDGAQQDFQRSGHFANGQFYVDPELLAGADVVRGPVSNIYGAGGIGGVAAFRTKDLDDILRPGEVAAVQGHGMYGTNGNQWLASTFGGARAAYGDVFLGGVFRDSGNYTSGNGTLTSLQCVSNCAGYPSTVIPGNTAVPYSGNEIESGLAKLTFRPGEGQQIKISAVTYNTNYNFGDTTGAGTTIPGIGVYGENVKNQTVTGQYTLRSPDTPLLDFKTEAYWNQTSVSETVKVPYVQSGIDFSGPPGTTSGFLLNTLGFRVNNASRFDTGPIRNTVTYGGDFNNDAINISTGCAPDQLINGACNLSLTPGGQRNTYGGFVEWKINYSSWLEVINAGRLDGFALSGDGSSESGARFSPKTTIGITPIRGLTPYFTYAEGYRAPSVTEAFVSGFHPGGFFYFEPNPNLQPEVGRTKEVGLNIKYDDVFSGGDKIRGKVSAFRNDITNYIDMVTDYAQMGPAPAACVQDLMIGGNPCLQYQNIGSARIQGLEFELNYDAGWWFTGVSGQHLTGQSLTTDPTVAGTCALAPTAIGCAGAPLASVPPDQVSFLLGTRLLDRKLNLAVRWTTVAAKPLSQIPTTVDFDINPFSPSVVPLFDSTRSYNLVNLYAGYQPVPDVIAAFSVENLLNVNYTKYMCCSTEAGYVVPNPGITFKGSLTIRYGVKKS